MNEAAGMHNRNAMTGRVLTGCVVVASLLLGWWILGSPQQPPPLAFHPSPVVVEARAEFLRARTATFDATTTATERVSATPSGGAPEGVQDSMVTFGGVVLNADRSPLAGARVMVKPLWGVGWDGAKDVLLPAIQRAQTDRDGRFAVPLSRRWFYDDFVFASIAEANGPRCHVQGEFRLHDQHVFVVAAEDQWRISGEVRVDRDGLRPLRVRLFSPSDRDVGSFGGRLLPLAQATTDSHDRVDLVGLVEPISAVQGPVRVFVSTMDEQPLAQATFPSMGAFAGAIASGWVVPVHDVRLPLTGLDRSVAAWRLGFLERNPLLPESAWRTASRPAAIDAVIAADSWLIEARLPDGRVRLGVLEPDDSIAWLATDPAQHRVDVQLVDSAGAPISGVYLVCRPESRGSASHAAFWRLAVASAATDADGRAVFALNEGRHLLSVEHALRGRSGLQAPTRLVDVPCDPVVVTAGGDAFVSVNVTFVPPKEAKGQVFVMMRRDGGEEWQSRTLGYPVGGNFIDGVAPGRWRWLVFSDGYEADTVVDLQAGVPQRTDLVLTPMTPCRGRLVDRHGDPLARAVVTAEGEPGMPVPPWRSSHTSADGTFALHLPPGCQGVVVQLGGRNRVFRSLGTEGATVLKFE